MRGWTLGSGSSGNAIVLESGAYRILIDCGFGPRAIAVRLRALGIAPESISALLMTHEHIDHAQGAERAQKKYRWPVYGSAGTLLALPEIESRWRRPIAPGVPVPIDGFTIEAIAVPHDAASCFAYTVTASGSGARAGVAHDLGAVPDELYGSFARCDALLLEANHDAEMLRTGPYTPALQERVRGGRGHLSNAQGAALAASVTHRGLRAISLLHLSAVNNTHELAEQAVTAAVRRAGFTGPVLAAPRREPRLAFAL